MGKSWKLFYFGSLFVLLQKSSLCFPCESFLLLFIPYLKREEKKSCFLTATTSSTAICHLPQDKHWRVLIIPEFCPPHKNTLGWKERMKQWCSLPQLPQLSHTGSHSLYLKDRKSLCPYPSTCLLVMSKQALHLPQQKEKKVKRPTKALWRLILSGPYLDLYSHINSISLNKLCLTPCQLKSPR